MKFSIGNYQIKIRVRWINLQCWGFVYTLKVTLLTLQRLEANRLLRTFEAEKSL